MERRCALSAFLLALLIAGCAEQQPQPGDTRVPSPFSLPEGRSFYLGFTPWPYDFTEEAVAYTYETLEGHTDLVAHHFDGGVPWEEALTGKAYHPNVTNEITWRVAHSKGKKVYLAVTPLSFDRKELADYWGEKTNIERTGRWKDKVFDDPEVITAYTNYCRFMIERFHPDYMAYGIEVDIALRGEDLDTFLVLVQHVYTTLKKEHPRLPLFLTLEVKETVDAEKRTVDRRFLQYSDYVAVSAYPYWVSHPPGDANPHNLPRSLFSQMAALAPEKPFAVAETGYIAEDLTFGGQVYVRGKEEWQADYVQFLFEEMNALNAAFVVWFVSRDYDKAWEQLERMGFEEVYKAWRDTGLIDGEGNPRMGLEVWDGWLDLPVLRKS